MLRTCNRVRIASLPVLRNDGGGRFADTVASALLIRGWARKSNVGGDAHIAPSRRI
ncbi:MAG: hypothetical protein LBM98_00885 [Oscillospiraceae bacterium]|nr:hypothetical protein [Oscillospiraceae bacterium]